MSPILMVAAGCVVVAGLLVLNRLVMGRTLVDRVLALDTLLVVVVNGLAIHAVITDSEDYLEVLVVVALLGFVGTTLLARLIERGRS